MAIGGKVTAGNVITLTTTYAPLTGGLQAVYYTVVSTDTLTTIATGLATAVNANSALTAEGLSAVAGTPANLSTAQTFSASKLLPYGSSTTTATAVGQALLTGYLYLWKHDRPPPAVALKKWNHLSLGKIFFSRTREDSVRPCLCKEYNFLVYKKWW